MLNSPLGVRGYSYIVELKAATCLHYDNIKQTTNYLNATKLELGILVNFGERSLAYKRILNSF